jgi:thiol-disulfide isomerase/thioredoxin
MKYVVYIGVVLGTISSPAISQIKSPDALIEQARSKYTNQLYVYTIAQVKIKSSIADDTSGVTEECFVDKKNKNELFLMPNDNGMFIHKGTQYYYYFPERNQYKKVPGKDKKYTVYTTRYKDYPFVDTDNFFNKMSKQKFAFTETDSSYRLMNFTYLYEFNKASLFLQKMRSIEYDVSNKGNHFEEITFVNPSLPDSLIAEVINDVIVTISNKSNEANILKEKARPLKIDREQLDMAVSKAVPNSDIRNKSVLIDFFYESCLPCIRSYPVMNNFYECSNNNFAVIGIDPVLSDTLNIDKHITRYKIQYPVITGAIAQLLAKNFAVSGFPTFAVIDPDGQVVFYKIGHSAAFLSKIKRKYTPDCNR